MKIQWSRPCLHLKHIKKSCVNIYIKISRQIKFVYRLLKNSLYIYIMNWFSENLYKMFSISVNFHFPTFLTVHTFYRKRAGLRGKNKLRVYSAVFRKILNMLQVTWETQYSSSSYILTFLQLFLYKFYYDSKIIHTWRGW